MTSAGAPTCSVPSFGARSITFAGVAVAIATTCSSVKPSPRNLLITQGRYGMPGVLPEKTWMSDEIVSGGQPCWIAGLGDRVVEAAAAMADVEDDAALLRRERRRKELAVLHDVGELARRRSARPNSSG